VLVKGAISDLLLVKSGRFIGKSQSGMTEVTTDTIDRECRPIAVAAVDRTVRRAFYEP